MARNDSMPSNDKINVIGYPSWFRGLVVLVATLILCGCQSATLRTAQQGAPEEKIAAHPVAPPRYPVHQVQYTSQAWLDEVPTEAYHGKVPPCSCCGPGAACSNAGGHGPVKGPRDEYLCDGGDHGTPAGVRHDWGINGLEQEDTLAHYDTVDGQVVVQPSNQVCIYAPRFGAVRRVVNLAVNQSRVGPGGIIDEMSLAAADMSTRAASSLQRHAPTASLGDQPASLFRTRVQAGGFQSRLVAMDLQGMLSPGATLQVVRLGVVDNREMPQLERAMQSAITWGSDVGAQVVVDTKQVQVLKSQNQVGQVYGLEEPDSPRIRLIKLASTGSAQPGEEVEFTLRFDNVGDQPLGNVTIVDNLTTRLEYVPDSAQASVEADFSADPNGQGSLILRWEIVEPVTPGAGGVLTFKTRVR